VNSPIFIVATKPLALKFLNKLTYNVFYRAYEKSAEIEINEWRASLNLKVSKTSLYRRIRELSVPMLHGYSPNLLSKPKDWPDNISVTGCWKLHDRYKKNINLSDDFTSWINADKPPIYFGFGSMPVLYPEKMVEMVNEVCKSLQVRAIINAGWSKIEDASFGKSMYLVQNTDLEYLFSKCKVVVHHGGLERRI
jgi:sterol 3beta-glucosyltransferase